MDKRYHYLFFDLDNTFWDVRQNQYNAQKELFAVYDMGRYFGTFENYLQSYASINEKLWIGYRDGKIGQEGLWSGRYVRLLRSVGIDDESLAMRMSDDYLRIVPSFHALMPYAKEVLGYLYGKGYPMALITNGFEQVQQDKVRRAGLSDYFQYVITSEKAGFTKPNAGIFEYALQKAGVKNTESVMIGDDSYNDIYGAVKAGMDTVYFNPAGEKHELHPTYEIRTLAELKDIF